MVNFDVNLEVICRVGAQQNETLRGCEMQGKDTTPAKINGPKMISPLSKVGNNQPA